jgi:hypothetical protein
MDLITDLAKCVGKGLCPGAKQEDTEACIEEAWDDFKTCLRTANVNERLRQRSPDLSERLVRKVGGL